MFRQKMRRASLKGQVEHRREADCLLSNPGDVVLVLRGVPRSLVIKCPDGCGDIITVNLDPRADKAWALYADRGRITLFPSVWRDSGCGAHFILWNNKIYWTETDRLGTDLDAVTRDNVLRLLSMKPKSYLELAKALDVIPWEILVACQLLVDENLVVEDKKNRGWFSLKR